MATAQYGYDHGNPFGDPNRFTRSTQQSEIDRFNDWMRAQPFWQQIRGANTGDFTDAQAQALVNALQANGITPPKDFHIDEGGNFNQKSRVKRNLIIAGAIAGGALTGGAALGAFGAGGAAAGGVGAAGGSAAAAGTGGALASTAIGSGVLPAIAGGAGAFGGTAAAATTTGVLGHLLAPAIAAGVSTAQSYFGSRAAGKANAIQAAATQAAIDYDKEKDRIAKEQYDQEYARKVQLEDADRKRQADLDTYTQQQTEARLGRLAPYRDFGAQGVATLSSLLTPRSTPLPPTFVPNTRPTAYGAGPSAPLSSLAAPAAAPTGPPIPPDGPPPPAIAQSLAALTAQPDPRDPRYAGRLS